MRVQWRHLWPAGQGGCRRRGSCRHQPDRRQFRHHYRRNRCERTRRCDPLSRWRQHFHTKRRYTYRRYRSSERGRHQPYLLNTAAAGATGDITISTNIAGLGGAATDGSVIVKADSGYQVTLSGNNTYGGKTTLDSVVLKAGSTTGFSQNSQFVVGTGTTLDLNGFNSSIGSLADGTAGGGVVTNNGASNATLTAGGDNSSILSVAPSGRPDQHAGAGQVRHGHADTGRCQHLFRRHHGDRGRRLAGENRTRSAPAPWSSTTANSWPVQICRLATPSALPATAASTMAATR